MLDGNKTVKGSRKIYSVSIPLDLAGRIDWYVDRYGFNRSDLVSRAIKFYLDSLGIKEGKTNGKKCK